MSKPLPPIDDVIKSMDAGERSSLHVADMRVDARGQMPESWCCIDCGVNTAPGFLTRAEVEAAFNAGVEQIEETIDHHSEVYMVRAVIWKRAGMEPFGGCLCVGCLENRLGRRLKPKDFCDHIFNEMPGTARLLRRQKRR
jgi:hypothetical protein